MFPRTLAALAMFGLYPLHPALAQRLSTTDRAALVAQVWSVARTTSATAWRAHLDWDAALADGLRAASRPQSDLRFLRDLRQLLALLDDGHADVLPPPALRSRLARPPLLLVSVERRPFLLDYAENDEMRVARPERLSEILAVQGVPAEDWIRDTMLPGVGGATTAARWEQAVGRMLEGERGTAVHLLLRRPDGGRRGISVTRTLALTDHWPFEPPPLTVDSLPGGVALVHVHTFADPAVVERFDRALASFAGLHGLILDLREAQDGRAQYAYGLLARLVPGALPAPRRGMPVYRPGFGLLAHPESAFTWYPLPPDTIWPSGNGPSYTGPLAVLSGSSTRGAAEDLLAVVHSTGRGVIVGAASAGSPGEALTVPLAAGWSVQLAVLSDALSDGTPVAETSVAPDVGVTGSVDDLLARRDVVLARAREYLESRAH